MNVWCNNMLYFSCVSTSDSLPGIVWGSLRIRIHKHHSWAWSCRRLLFLVPLLLLCSYFPLFPWIPIDQLRFWWSWWKATARWGRWGRWCWWGWRDWRRRWCRWGWWWGWAWRRWVRRVGLNFIVHPLLDGECCWSCRWFRAFLCCADQSFLLSGVYLSLGKWFDIILKLEERAVVLSESEIQRARANLTEVCRTLQSKRGSRTILLHDWVYLYVCVRVCVCVLTSVLSSAS